MLFMEQSDMDTLIDKAEELGASAAKAVRISSIKTGVWTRMKCQYGCPNYARSLCCPPYTPEYAFMQNFLKEYDWGLLVQHTISIDTENSAEKWNSVDRAAGMELLNILLGLEKTAFLMNYYKAFSMKAGRCRLCETCNLKKCIHPQEARPSAEACGIDVFALARDQGFDAHVLTGPVKELKIYGLLLIE